jgi:hypothetical protein
MLEQQLMPNLREYETGMQELRDALSGHRADARSSYLKDQLAKTTPGSYQLDLAPAGPGLSLTNVSGLGAFFAVPGGLAVGAVLMGLATVAVAGPVAAGFAVLGGPLVTKMLTRKVIVNRAVKDYRKALTENAGEIAADYAKRYGDAVRFQTTDLGAELSRTLRETVEEAERAISDLRGDQIRANEQKLILHELIAKLDKIEKAVQDLVGGVLSEAR